MEKTNKINIGIITLRFDYRSYFNISNQYLDLYAKKYGYDIIIEDASCVGNDRTKLWAKPFIIRKHLNKYDYLLYLDADTIGLLPIEPIIEKHPNSLFIMSDNRPWDNGANVGVFIVKNTPLSHSILDEWWNVPIYDRRTAFDWPPEQRGFEWHIRPRWHDENRIVIVDMNEFIIHLAGKEDDYRKKIIKEYLEKFTQ